MDNQQMMHGKVVVVIGAGGGIGREIALAMARHGASVVINDIGVSLTGKGANAGPAQQVADEITAAGGRAIANTDSVADAAGAQRIIDGAVDAFGRIDCVVNNAGILRDNLFHKMSGDEWDAVIKVHLYGSYYMSRAAALFPLSGLNASYGDIFGSGANLAAEHANADNLLGGKLSIQYEDSQALPQ